MRYLQFLIYIAAFSSVAGAQQLLSPGIPYRLQASDTISLEYEYTPEYNQITTVEPDGVVRLKLLGSIKIGGMTLDEASAAIMEKASASLRKPELTITLKDYVKPHFTVAGQVERPGTYDMHGSVTFLQAIAMSGGVKDFTRQDQVLLVRKMNTDYAEVRVVDLKKISSKKGVREDFLLKPDDMLLVPKNRLGKIEPYVRVTSMAFSSLYGVQVFK